MCDVTGPGVIFGPGSVGGGGRGRGGRGFEPIERLEGFCGFVDGSFPIRELEVAGCDVGFQDGNLVFEVIRNKGEGAVVGGDGLGILGGFEKLIRGSFLGVRV